VVRKNALLTPLDDIASTYDNTDEGRSYWIPGSSAPRLSERHDAFLRLLQHDAFKEERLTKVGLYALGTSTTLASNKSQ